MRGEKLMANPIKSRTHYYNKNEARHAKEVGPRNRGISKVGTVLFSKTEINGDGLAVDD